MTHATEPATSQPGSQVVAGVVATVAGWFLFSLLGSLVIQGWRTALLTAVCLGAVAYRVRPSRSSARVIRGFVIIFAIVGLVSAVLQLVFVSA